MIGTTHEQESKTQGDVYLKTLSPKDRIWDKRKTQNEALQGLYRETEYGSYAFRLGTCSGRLVFGFKVGEDGICKLVLQAARFCRVPTCPICQGRRALKWYAKTLKILPQLLEDYPRARFILLTLTVKNPHVGDLRATLKAMHHAWTKMVKRKQWKVEGWIRTTEVTREYQEGKPVDYVHPHYHCLLMVKPSYFTGKSYLSQEKWTELWQSCLGVDYTPVVDVRSIRSPKGSSETLRQESIMSSVVEVVKYTVKPSDVILEGSEFFNGDGLSNQDFLVELTKQLHGIKKVATGGLLKSYFKQLEEEPDDLVHIDEDGATESEPDTPQIAFDWATKEKHYKVSKDEA